MKKRNHLVTKMFAVMAAATIIMSSANLTAKANNYKDTAYKLQYYGDGGDVLTGYRSKTDDSYAYIKHMGDAGALVAVQVKGDTYGIYSGKTGMNGKGSYVTATTGKGYYIVNYVWETFKTTKSIRLALCPTVHHRIVMHGWWSPDSI